MPFRTPRIVSNDACFGLVAQAAVIYSNEELHNRPKIAREAAEFILNQDDVAHSEKESPYLMCSGIFLRDVYTFDFIIGL